MSLLKKKRWQGSAKIENTNDFSPHDSEIRRYFCLHANENEVLIEVDYTKLLQKQMTMIV